MKVLGVLFALVLPTYAQAGATENPLAELQRGQPKDVRKLVERLVLCRHWGGEELTFNNKQANG